VDKTDNTQRGSVVRSIAGGWGVHFFPAAVGGAGMSADTFSFKEERRASLRAE
jgi:hypothetical protein